MSKAAQSITGSDAIPFRLHPRVFGSLGADLVTSDVVAIIELVKNSYDAHATRVDVRLVKDGTDGNLLLEIEDNGSGMTREVLETAWAVVATPYRVTQVKSKQGRKGRRVSGAKGLGRLSAARLGDNLAMYTKSAEENCWEIKVDWSALATSDDLSDCEIQLRKHDEVVIAGRTGTLLRIRELKSDWDDRKIADLREQLSRLISPFARVDDFEIYLTSLSEDEAEPVEIKPAEFLSRPPYLLKGSVNKSGKIECTYTYAPLQAAGRQASITRELWRDDFSFAEEEEEENRGPQCGSFEFEIRVWDLDKEAETFKEISHEFNLNLATLRKNIKSYQGLSLYRDEILVLPKSESAKDWLGLDLRRVSKTGKRISTSNIVGYVAVTAENNPQIEDTSDRERLVDNQGSRDFKKLLWEVAGILENEREKDRLEIRKERPLKELFAALSTQPLIEKMSVEVAQGAEPKKLISLVEEHGVEVEKAVGEIEQIMIYYNQLANLGALAAVLVHEVGNRVGVISRLTRQIRKLVEKKDVTALTVEEDLGRAEQSERALSRLVDRLAPLASRTFRTRRRDANLAETIQNCVGMREPEIEAKKINVVYDPTIPYVVAIDPGELDSIILNLLDNAIYWLSTVKDRPRRIEFKVLPSTQPARIKVEIHDSGPGVDKDDEDRIFSPGVSRKTGGLGMGLFVVGELVSQHDGKFGLLTSPALGGASFGFDLPLSERTK
jgi:signal transduction histidine kinase